MKFRLPAVIAKYATKGVLPDTNVLLVFLVGSFDRNLVPMFKRTNNYTPDDFDLLRHLLGNFQRILITPHVLTEISNLSMTIGEPRLSRYLTVLVRTLQPFEERHVPKEPILASPLLSKLGVTDLSIMEAAKAEGCLVLTDDLLATAYLRGAGCEVLNFNHLRWDS